MDIGSSSDHFADVLDLGSISEIFMEDGNDGLVFVPNPIDGFDIPSFLVQGNAQSCMATTYLEGDGLGWNGFWGCDLWVLVFLGFFITLDVPFLEIQSDMLVVNAMEKLGCLSVKLTYMTL